MRFKGPSDPRSFVEMRWERPDFVALDSLPINQYIIFSTNLKVNINVPVRGFHKEILFNGSEEQHSLLVSVNTVFETLSAPAECIFNTIDRGKT